MVARLLDRFFLLIVSRPALMILASIFVVALVAMGLEQISFLRGVWRDGLPGHDHIQDMEHVIDGIAGMLVAGGVFFESREPLRNMALRKKHETLPIEGMVNEVAHHNGMGLLLVGLFMEIGTAFIGLPKRVIDTSGLETAVFGLCLFFTVVAVIILVDFVKDFARSYFISEGATHL